MRDKASDYFVQIAIGVIIAILVAVGGTVWQLRSTLPCWPHPTPTPSPTVCPTPSAVEANCIGDLYNCDHFSSCDEVMDYFLR